MNTLETRPVARSTATRPMVVLVEDADELRTMLSAFLEHEGFSVVAVADGEAALEALDRCDPMAIVLDVVLPGMDGFETCRRMRNRTDAHVIMLTARNEEVDKIVGFATGADDYMTKPFSPRELVARLRAILRRRTTTMRERLAVGSLRIDVAARTATVGDTALELTRIEFDLLMLMARRTGTVVTRNDLLQTVWGPTWVGSDHLVEVHVSNLRRKLVNAGGAELLHTVRRVGYRLSEPLKRSA